MRGNAGSAPSQPQETLASLLRRYREARELTQEQLAEQSGVAIRTISDLERGVTLGPQQDTVEGLEKALKLPPEECERLEATIIRTRKHASVPSPPQTPLSHNLPVPPMPFIGRRQEVEDVWEMLSREDVRLLTLVGPPGVGKTRLALQAADQAVQRYPAEFSDGVFWVPLASLQDPELVITMIARALGVHDAGRQHLVDTLITVIGDKKVLVMLDNFEHLMSASAHLIRITDHCPHLTLLVTSRARLDLFREQPFLVPSLSVPERNRTFDAVTVVNYEAVRLFRARAQQVCPDFRVTDKNADLIARICQRLDGLPLALELAAARMNVLTLKALLEGLSSRLTLLTHQARDADPRQRTLRVAIDSSYALLEAPEQSLFAQLAVFAGGCTMDAARAVCSAADRQIVDVLEGLAVLVDSSLLQREDGEDGERRFVMLQTIREYASERLERSGNSAILHECHAAYYLGLAEEAEREISGPKQVSWQRRLEADHDNLRAALRWFLDRKDGERASQLAGALHRFWHLSAHWSEGRRWLEEALAQHKEATPTRALALDGAAHLAYRKLDYDAARVRLEERLALCRKLGDNIGVASALTNLGGVALQQGRYEEAVSLELQSLRLARLHNYLLGEHVSLQSLGVIARRRGSYQRARILLEKSLALAREMNDPTSIGSALVNLAAATLAQQDYKGATALYAEAITVCQQNQNITGMPYCLEGFAVVAAMSADLDRSARLFGAADALRAKMDLPREPKEPFIPDDVYQAAQARTTAWREGWGMTIGQVMAVALP